MASSLHQWESDPLFSAAEVVQDSADRMESLFRLVLHEQRLVHVNCPDPKLLTSIEYHKRDLATMIETAKWQLEDFERAVSSSAMVDKSRTREDVVSRHTQFIRAIWEQIIHVERSIEGLSKGDSIRNSEWVDLNEHDRDVLALFLTGGNPSEHLNHSDMEDGGILRRFLDPTSTSSLNDNEIIEHDSREFKKINMNEDIEVNREASDIEENILRKVVSKYPTRSGSDEIDHPLDLSCNGHGDNNPLDLEANEATFKSILQENRLRGFHSRINLFGLLNKLWSACRNRAMRNYTKRLKDGDEQRHSLTSTIVSCYSQGQHTGLRFGSISRSFQVLCFGFHANTVSVVSHLAAGYPRFPCQIQINRQLVRIIVTSVFTLISLGMSHLSLNLSFTIFSHCELWYDLPAHLVLLNILTLINQENIRMHLFMLD